VKRREDGEPNWPVEFVEFDPEKWKSEFDWKAARIKWARSQGYKQYKLLPLLQRMTRTAPPGAEPGNGDGE
jgi:hypothetical protein